MRKVQSGRYARQPLLEATILTKMPPVIALSCFILEQFVNYCQIVNLLRCNILCLQVIFGILFALVQILEITIIFSILMILKYMASLVGMIVTTYTKPTILTTIHILSSVTTGDGRERSGLILQNNLKLLLDGKQTVSAVK